MLDDNIHYFLPAGLEEDTEASMAIRSAAGDTVYTFDGLDAEPGLHRVHWGFRGEPTAQVRLRTKPDEYPHLTLPERGWRSMPGGGRMSIFLPPGEYTADLAVGDVRRSEPFTVLKDPNSMGSEADILAQMPVLEELFETVERSAALINQIEWVRKQLGDLRGRLAQADLTDEERREIREASLTVEADLKEIEYHFHDLRHTGTGQDGLRWKRLLYSRLITLARNINGSDHPPTDQALELAAELASEVVAHEVSFEEIQRGSLAELNALLAERGVTHVVVGQDD